jgi:hypothetical protein
MTMYKCNICNYNTKRMNDYTKHLKTNKHLNNINNTYNNNNDNTNIIIHKNPQISTNISKNPQFSIIGDEKGVNSTNINDNKCKYCSKIFKSNSSMKYHYLKTCLEIPDKIKNRLIIKHNNHKSTKHKLPLVETVQNANKIINNNNLGTINNINITLNPMGEETIDHIPDEELNEILKADHNMMYQLKNAMALVPANNNVYLNLRTKMLFYIDKNNEIRVTKISQYNAEFCYMWMNKINKLIQDNPERFGDINIKRFEDTYDIYSCRITQDNFDEIEHIEKSHHELINKFFEDLIMVNLNNNIQSKSLLTQHSPDFNRLT